MIDLDDAFDTGTGISTNRVSHPRRARLRRERLNDAVAHLRTSPTFADCSPDDIAALLHAGSSTVIPGHWAFLHEATPADSAYLLLNGSARVFRHGVAVATVGGGDVVGEAALLNGTLRNATVSSVSGLKALRIDRYRFADLMRRRPALRTAFYDLAESRLTIRPV